MFAAIIAATFRQLGDWYCLSVDVRLEVGSGPLDCVPECGKFFPVVMNKVLGNSAALDIAINVSVKCSDKAQQVSNGIRFDGLGEGAELVITNIEASCGLYSKTRKASSSQNEVFN